MDETDKQQEGPSGIGREKPDDSSEVGGRGRQLLYTCYNDGAGNYVDPSWKYWTCWRCGTTIYADGTVTMPTHV